MDRMSARADAASTKTCPTCGKAAVQRYQPFCSKRCADVDLHRWLSGVYAVPGKEDEQENEAGAAKPDDDLS